MSHLDNAKTALLESQNIYQRFYAQEDLAKTLNNLGNIYRHQGNTQEALRCYEQCLDIYELLGMKLYRHGVALAYGNLGLLAIQQQELNKAISYYEQPSAALKI
ncbi:MAG: tetratricopeptide repeat protein [Deinococcales bacterium]